LQLLSSIALQAARSFISARAAVISASVGSITSSPSCSPRHGIVCLPGFVVTERLDADPRCARRDHVNEGSRYTETISGLISECFQPLDVALEKGELAARYSRCVLSSAG